MNDSVLEELKLKREILTKRNDFRGEWKLRNGMKAIVEEYIDRPRVFRGYIINDPLATNGGDVWRLLWNLKGNNTDNMEFDLITRRRGEEEW